MGPQHTDSLSDLQIRGLESPQHTHTAYHLELSLTFHPLHYTYYTVYLNWSPVRVAPDLLCRAMLWAAAPTDLKDRL